MNTITVNFIECEPTPANGYNVQWRVAGSADPYTDAGNFTSNPAVFTDSSNPDGTQYEGFIRADCSESGGSGESGSLFGNNVSWSTVTGEYAIAMVGVCTGINSQYEISGGTPGDIVTVRANFNGLIQKISGLFTRANLDISSPDGTTDSDVSTCYTDTSSHGFAIQAETVITMVGTTAIVNLAAVVHNSSDSATSVTITILDINGAPVNISTGGCKGNSGTGGTC